MTKPGSSGFARLEAGGSRPIPVPAAFFHELLPQIDHLGELKVTLYALWSVARQHGQHPYLSRSELRKDSSLAAMMEPGERRDEALEEALERAVQRGTLLRRAEQGERGEVLYFLNDDRGRAALAALDGGEWKPAGAPRHLELQAERPNIYLLYEQNIGPLTPLIAERLLDAQNEYPAEWIESAFRIAVENNARKWRYIEAILEDWKTKGRDEREDRRDPEATRRRYLGGEFGDYIKG